MRKILFLLILINSFNLFAQYEDKWKEVYQLELDGKIKSAQEKVQEIYKKAKRKNDEVQIIKCFFYLSKFEQVFDEKAQTTIINNVQKEINEAKPVSKALLSFIYITILEDYYKNNYGIIKNRTNIETKKSKDFLTWTVIDFSKEINQYYEQLLVNEKELRVTNIKIYNAVFDISHSVDIKNYSIYDFLAQKKANYLKSRITSWKQKKSSDFEKELLTFYNKPDAFVKYDTKKLEDENFRKLISFLQNNEKYYLEQNNYEKIDFAYFERLKYVRESIWNEEYYLDKVEDLEKSTSNIFLKQFLRIERLKYYQTKTYKNGEINLYNNALALVDTILNTKVNINALAEAENIKLEILKKSLSVSIPKISYSEQNTRAFINFKNVDSITISYFEFPQKWNYVFKNYYYSTSEKWINKDSIIQTFVKNNKPLKSQKIKLPNKHDYFEYSTEILLEKLE